jgi:predicted ArsR family transcriptional regulator
MTTDPRASIAEAQQKIMALLKQHGESTMAELAEHLNVSYEAVRQQLNPLVALRLVERLERPNQSGTGRPLRYYSLSSTGDHLFPKNYDELAVELIDAIGDELGTDGLRRVLAALTDEQVARWEPALEGKDLASRLKALKGIYIENDPFTEVSEHEGELQLVERNCPFLNVASKRPALCSTTVNVLSRLLGYRVTRTKRFQDGDGRCVFHVHVDQPLQSTEFQFESEIEQPTAG